ncbi:MAG: hypothetical protein KC910_33440, partial [Candidatus Eremiobacteraeota bacterium]|nr:hypothetical protein [Candidatus Eremiobacteraeota bacterium]
MSLRRAPGPREQPLKKYKRLLVELRSVLQGLGYTPLVAERHQDWYRDSFRKAVDGNFVLLDFSRRKSWTRGAPLACRAGGGVALESLHRAFRGWADWPPS